MPPVLPLLSFEEKRRHQQEKGEKRKEEELLGQNRWKGTRWLVHSSQNTIWLSTQFLQTNLSPKRQEGWCMMAIILLNVIGFSLTTSTLKHPSTKSRGVSSSTHHPSLHRALPLSLLLEEQCIPNFRKSVFLSSDVTSGSVWQWSGWNHDFKKTFLLVNYSQKCSGAIVTPMGLLK